MGGGAGAMRARRTVNVAPEEWDAVWPRLVGLEVASVDAFEARQDRLYGLALEDTFGGDAESAAAAVPAEGTVPLFGASFTLLGHTGTGRRAQDAAKRVLSVCGHTQATPEYCPLLVDLALVLCRQLRESAAYAVLCAVVRQKGRYLVCSPKEQAAHGRAFEELVAAKFKKTGAHLSRIAAPCGGLFERWILRLFLDTLPYAAVLRVVSGYLSGGLKVFYRIGLAIVKTHKRKMKASTSDADGVYAMLSAAVREQDTNVLIQTAFGIQLKSAQIDAAVRRHANDALPPQRVLHGELHNQDTGSNVGNTGSNVGNAGNVALSAAAATSMPSSSMHRPKIIQSGDASSPCEILTPEMCIDIHRWLPKMHQQSDYRLVFSTATEGYAMKTLIAKVGELDQTVIVIRPTGDATLASKVIGVYIPHQWYHQSANKMIRQGSTRSAALGTYLGAEGSVHDSFVFRCNVRGGDGGHQMAAYRYGDSRSTAEGGGGAGGKAGGSDGNAGGSEEKTGGTGKAGDGGDARGEGGQPLGPAAFTQPDGLLLGQMAEAGGGRCAAITIDADMKQLHVCGSLEADVGNAVATVGIVEVFALQQS